MINYQLLHTFKYLDKETESLEETIDRIEDDDYNDDVFVASLKLDKLLSNMDYARSILLDLESDLVPSRSQSQKSGNSTLSGYRLHIQRLNDKIQQIEHRIRNIQTNEAELFREQQAKQTEVEIASDISSIDSLRKRSVSATSPSESKEIPLESKLTLQKDIQDSLSTEILGMVSTLKSNAIAFADKISQDQDVVEGTAFALNKTSGTMDKVGSRLSEYHSSKAIGWWFYIWAIVFMVIAVFGGMIVVRLFPKW